MPPPPSMLQEGEKKTYIVGTLRAGERCRGGAWEQPGSTLCESGPSARGASMEGFGSGVQDKTTPSPPGGGKTLDSQSITLGLEEGAIGKPLTPADPGLPADTVESQPSHPLLTLPLPEPSDHSPVCDHSAPPTGYVWKPGSPAGETLRWDEEANTQERGHQMAVGAHPHDGRI